MKRYIVTSKPIFRKGSGKLIGHIVRLSDGSTYFEQSKRVPAGHAVNFGPQWGERRA